MGEKKKQELQDNLDQEVQSVNSSEVQTQQSVNPADAGNEPPQDVAKLIEIVVSVNETPIPYRIRYFETSTPEELDKSIRQQIKIKENDQYELRDYEGNKIVLDGSIKEGTYWLKHGDEDSDASDYDDTSSNLKGGKKLPKVHCFKGHEYVAKHYHIAPICTLCRGPIIGIGKAGYQCKVCSINLHKRCYMNYTVECGASLHNLPECGKCRQRFKEEDNTPDSCVYHASNLTQGWCTRCSKMISPKNPGCLTGPHEKKKEKKEAKPKKDHLKSRKSKGKLKEANLEDDSNSVTCDCTNHFSNQHMRQQYTISVQRLYDTMFSDTPTNLQNILETRSYTEIEIQPWNNNERNIKYVMPFSSPFGNSLVSCTEVHSIEWKHNNQAFTVTVHSLTPSVPYGETFNVVTKYCVSLVNTHCSLVLVTSEVKWIKKSMLTSAIITSKSKEGIDDFLTFVKDELDKIQIAYMAETGATGSPEMIEETEAKVEKPSSSDFYSKKTAAVIRQPLWLSCGLMLIIIFLFFSSFKMYLDLKEIESQLFEMRASR